MARYFNSSSGTFSGKWGPVVGSSFRGKHILRASPRKTTKKPTANQLVQRARFSAVSHFLSPANRIVSQYFGQPEEGKTRRNLAMSYHLHHAVHWDGEKAHMLYHKAIFAQGDLLGFPELTVTLLPFAKLQLTWSNTSTGNASPTDELKLLVIAPLGDFYDYFSEVSTRSAGSATVQLPEYLAGSNVHCWVFFVAADGPTNSSSAYLGQVRVSE